MKNQTIIKKINNEFENEWGTAMLNIVPNWNKDYSLKNFTVYIASFKEDDFTDFSLRTKVDTDGLIDLLVELRGHHIDNYAVCITAYYHGDSMVRDFYNMLIDNLECYSEFDMYYEHG